MIVEDGRVAALELLIAQEPQAWLFKTNVTPADATTLADLTECDFSGYGRQPLAFGPVQLTAGGVAFAVSDMLLWTYSGPPQNIVYLIGVVLPGAGSGEFTLYCLEKVEPPKSMAALGDQLARQITLSEDDGG